MLVVIGIFISGFSSIATGLNFIVTIHRLRAPGLTWYRLPVFVWSLYSTSVILVLATPVLAITLVLLMFETLFHVGVFDPRLGGDPLLFQHLFWFYSHPAVYIMILPGLGVVSEIIPVFARKALFGYKFVVWASVSIAVIGFFVWGHHMFVSGQSLFASVTFSLLSLLRRRALGDQGVQLARHAAQGPHPFRRADDLRAGFHRAVHHGRDRPGCSWRRWRRTSICTTPISSSRISTTSWSAAWSRPISRLCIIGGRRSRARCIPK